MFTGVQLHESWKGKSLPSISQRITKLKLRVAPTYLWDRREPIDRGVWEKGERENEGQGRVICGAVDGTVYAA